MLVLFILASCIVSSFSMEGFIVGGRDAEIEEFPHSVLAKINCFEEDSTQAHFTCGSSIINQQILLSAAHCLHGCSSDSTVGLFVGYATAAEKPQRYSFAFVLHQQYSSTTFENDIMLIVMNSPLNLNKKVRRVAIMRRPPYTEQAMVAGWGLIDEVDRIKSKRLKGVIQQVWKKEVCQKKFHNVQGTFCASAYNNEGYASMGDSGSALMVRGYIQIGIVSYKLPSVSKEVLIYTDVAYYYDWIKTNTKHVFCAS